MERVVLQRDETVLQIEALRVVVLGEEVHREDADPLRHLAGCFQEVEEKQFAETLTSAGQIDGKPPEVGRGQRVSGQPCLVIRRKMVAQKCTGRRGVVGEHLLLGAANRDVDTAHSPLVIDGRVLANEGVQRGLATVKGSPLVVRRQQLDARLIHGTV